jgi:uncharacterized iron-regulated membrane protein
MQSSEFNIPYTAAAYRMVWRWHFYAGLFCLPFIILLSISGSIYLFRPQIEAWADQSLNHLNLSGPVQTLDAQITAALAVVPDARLKGVEVRQDANDATRIFVITPNAEEIRVVMRPDDLSILSLAPVKDQFSIMIRSLHGDLWAGTPGALLVELAASWALVMIGTGLYLWWPSRLNSLAGVLYPRLSAGGRSFLKDIHGVTGFWLSFMALFMLISGLPWTKVWGDGFRELRRMTRVATPPDWTNGPASEHAAHRRDFAQAVSQDETPLIPSRLSFDAALVRARDLQLASPVLLSPPSPQRPNWLVKAEPQNRPLGRSVELDSASGAIVKDTPFSTKPFMDQVVAYGVAAHEGQLFGWPNVALGLLAALGFMTLSTTAIIMWLRRRPGGTLGAPRIIGQVRIHPLIIVFSIVILGTFLPLFGASLISVLVIERFVLPFWPKAQNWLGLGQVTIQA